MAFDKLLKNMFMTSDKKREEEDRYLKKIFPLGKEQQDWENKIFDELFKDKDRISTIKYVSFVRREMYIDGIALEDDHLNNKEYKRLLKRMKISDDEERLIEKLVILEHKAKDLSELPTIEQIKDR